MIHHKDGYGIVDCADDKSSVWVKNMAKNFIFSGQKTRGWSRFERGIAWQFKGFLRGAMWKLKKDSRNVLQNILKMNGLEGEFEIQKWESQNNGKGIFIAFLPKGTLIDQLTNRKELNAGVCKLKLEKIRVV